MYHLVHFCLFLMNFLSHVTGPTEGKAANTNLTTARWMGPSLMEWWGFTVQLSVRQPPARRLEPLRLHGPTERATDHWAAFNPFCSGRVCRATPRCRSSTGAWWQWRRHVFESIRLNYDEVIEVSELWWTYWILWTMNFMNYELLWTQTVIWWTAVRVPKCCVCIFVCVAWTSDDNKNL